MSGGLVFVVLVTMSFVLAACACNGPREVAPFRSANVSARLESPVIGSGNETFLVVDAVNNGTLPLTGMFAIVPENDQVLVEERSDRFVVRPMETTGQKRYRVIGTANSVRQDILITVRFNDTVANEIVGSTSVLLSVHK